MHVRVIVPWQAGCDQRERIWGWLRARWSQVGWPLTIAERHSEGNADWVKAEAVMPAVSAAAEDILVVADADVWCDGIADAVIRVNSGAPWAVPHHLVRRLTPAATDAVLAGAPLGPDVGLGERAYKGLPGGGIVVLRRDVALDVPLDPRFVGWGGEDQAWAYALSALYGEPWRGAADLFHLWHPPQKGSPPRRAPHLTPEQRRAHGIGSRLNEQLRRRYRIARSDPRRMRTVIDEVREVSAR